MPTRVYQKKGEDAAALTEATGVIPSGPSTRSADEESWPFAVSPDAREAALVDGYQLNRGFVFVREDP